VINVGEKHTDNHIKFIIDHSSLFGMTKEYIQQVYDNHGESLEREMSSGGLEGMARVEIITRAIKNGWIRVRLQSSGKQAPVYWTVQPYELSYKAKDNIWTWAMYMKTHERYTFGEINILSLRDGKVSMKTSIEKIIKGELFTEAKMIKTYTFQDVVRSKNISLQKLNESSLSRAYQLSNEAESFGIISAFRGSHSRKQNMELTKKLQAKVSSLGYGYFTMIGH